MLRPFAGVTERTEYVSVSHERLKKLDLRGRGVNREIDFGAIFVYVSFVRVCESSEAAREELPCPWGGRKMFFSSRCSCWRARPRGVNTCRREEKRS